MSDILRPNEPLFVNQMLTSINGEYMLILQADGNMVLYEKVHHEDGSIELDVAWATETLGENALYAAMQEDGNFVLYDHDGVALWQTSTAGRPGSFLQLKDDGNLVINEIAHSWMAYSAEDEDDEEEEGAEEIETDADASVDPAGEALARPVEEAMVDEDMLARASALEKQA